MLKNTRMLVLTLLLLIALAMSGCSKDPSQDAESDSQGSQTSAGVSDFVFPEETEENAGLTNFSTLDINGNVVDSSIFAESEVTMVNLWGTFCSPCLEEMPFLAELDAEYEDQGFNIIGIVADAQTSDLSIDPDQLSKVQEIIDSTGADYTHLIPSMNLITGFLSKTQYIPYTVFVDNQGQIIGEEYVGSRSKQEWAEIIESML